MTFVKLIKDLTLSFGEIQRKNAAYNNVCMKNSQKMTKQRKHLILKNIRAGKGTN